MTALKNIFFLLLLPFAVTAQSIQVDKASALIEGVNSEGYQVDLNADEDAVKSSLSRYLKSIGKTKTSAEYITVSEPLIAGRKHVTALYAKTKINASGTVAWIGVASGGEEVSPVSRDIEKLVYDFGVAFHREQIQLQIDESERALQAVEKQQLRLMNQKKDLNTKRENNKREKIELEKALVENKLELEDLTRRLALNAQAQDSVALATEQIRKVVEMHKDRQRKVK